MRCNRCWEKNRDNNFYIYMYAEKRISINKCFSPPMLVNRHKKVIFNNITERGFLHKNFLHAAQKSHHTEETKISYETDWVHSLVCSSSHAQSNIKLIASKNLTPKVKMGILGKRGGCIRKRDAKKQSP